MSGVVPWMSPPLPPPTGSATGGVSHCRVGDRLVSYFKLLHAALALPLPLKGSMPLELWIKLARICLGQDLLGSPVRSQLLPSSPTVPSSAVLYSTATSLSLSGVNLRLLQSFLKPFETKSERQPEGGA